MLANTRKIDVITNAYKKAMIDLGWNFVGEDNFDEFNRLKFTPPKEPKEGEPKSVDFLFIRKDSNLMTEIGYLDVPLDLISKATIIVNITQKLNLPYSPLGKDKRKDNFLYDPEGYLNKDLTPKPVLDEDVFSSLLQVKIASIKEIEEIKAARKAGNARSQLMTRKVVVKKQVDKKEEPKTEQKEEGKLASLLALKKPEQKLEPKSETKPELKLEPKTEEKCKSELPKPETKHESKPETHKEEKKVEESKHIEEKEKVYEVEVIEAKEKVEKIEDKKVEPPLIHHEDEREPHIQLAVLLIIVVVIAVIVNFLHF
ncbi:MAG: hypothetical protein QXT63_05665 [Thermoplasmata archaeon]